MDMINLVNQNSSVIQISPNEAARDLFSYLCQYIKCGNQCRSKILSEQCGKESNENLLEFYRLVVASMKQTVVESQVSDSQVGNYQLSDSHVSNSQWSEFPIERIPM
uniref:Uncharacterized protein n=1 Tax=Romanomermis culicivorax TaxID=13658 RepID=A0A915K6S4_ROMCU